MPVYLRPNELFVKNPNGTGYLPQNVISQNSTSEILEAFDQTVANTQESLNTMTSEAQQAVDGIEAQKNTMIASIASVAGQGTDTTLTQSGVAADAKVVGDLKSALGEDVALSGWVQGGINANTGATNTYNTRARLELELPCKYIQVHAGENYYVDAGVWVNGIFVGIWNGETCVIGTLYTQKVINIKKLIDTMNPSKIVIVARNITNTVLDQSDVPNNMLFVSPYYVTTDDFEARSSRIESEIWKLDSVAWEQGGINATTGDFSALSYRIRAQIPFYASSVSIGSGLKLNLYAFSGSEYIGIWNGTTFEKAIYNLSGYIDLSWLKNYSYTYWAVVGYTNDASITPDAGSNIIVYKNTISELTSNYHFPACPNIIYQCRGFDDIPPESKWYVKEAVNNQYDRVRFTVRKTTDGYYFNCHDANINNYVVNSDGSALTEAVSATGKTLSELNQYDWGLKFGEKYAGATVPLLDDCLKYASVFNLGVTWHSATSEVETQEAVTEQLAMIDKYGLTDNLIVVCSAGFNLATFQRFLAHNKRISYYVGGLPAFFSDEYNIGYINSLKTNYNKIYVQLYPWGTTPTAEFIALAKANDWELYDSITISESDLCNESMFSKGYSLREIYNVRMVKDTVRRWANGLIT